MMIYDEEYVQRFRAKAITDVNQLVIGHVYYTSCHRNGCKLESLQTNKEHYDGLGLTWPSSQDQDDLGWMTLSDDNQFRDRDHSLHDNNIGASYNPWLVFESKELADEYYEGLIISHEDDDFGFQFETWDDEFRYEAWDDE